MELRPRATCSGIVKAVWAVIALVWLAVSPSSAWAVGSRYPQVAARHKSGPVTIRGITHRVTSHGFSLQTTSKGSYAVNDAPPTHFIQKGRTGGVVVVEGDHVGVRGYVVGRTIRAIEVRVYPVAAKPVSVRGSITGITGNRLRVRTTTGSLTVIVSGSTVIRTSSGMLTASSLRTGDRIEAKVVSSRDNTAIHIHVYRARVPARHVQLAGTVLAVGTHSLVISQSGTSHAIGLTSATQYYSGASHGSASLHRGAQVTVYACCAGQPLVATSIHIHVTRSAQRATELRGSVVSISSTVLRLDTPRAPLVQLQSSTVYEVGAVRTTNSGVHPGDLVSVRGRASGGILRATRVHVYGASRRITTVRGMVAGVFTTSIQVVQRGSTYVVQIGKQTTVRLSGSPIRASQIRAGDRAQAVGRLNGHQLQATSVDVKRLAPKLTIVRGTVTAAGTSWLVVTHASGAKDTVRLAPGAHIVFEGRQTTGGALFAGVRVIARGTRAGAALQATSVTATARSAAASGRFAGAAGGALLLRRSTGTVTRVDLPTGITLLDRARPVALRQIGRGAYLRVSGYEELSKALRAVAVTVLHPTVDVRGVLSWQGRIATVRTTAGESYVALFVKSSTISDSRLDGNLKSVDLPGGAAVHVSGTVDISGSLAVHTLTVHLQSLTVRAKADSLAANGLLLKLTGTSVHVRFTPGTAFFQGSTSLNATDIVAGDDVTVYGYALRGGTILARKLIVHRRLLGLDGMVASVADGGFALTATDGAHTVLVSGTTIVSGPAGTILAAGMTVHVTGYLRGDAAILATRVRILKTA